MEEALHDDEPPFQASGECFQWFRQWTKAPAHRLADEIVIGIKLKVNCVGTNLRIKNLHEELAQGVQCFLRDISRAFREGEWHQKILAVLHPDSLVVERHRTHQYLRSWD